MRFVRFLMIGVAIFLEGVLAGCGGARQAAVNVQTAEGGSPANVFPVRLVPDIRGTLPAGETVRAEAGSWTALVAVARPDFSWDHNVMWVERGVGGKWIFHVDQARIWQTPNGEMRWVLLKTGERGTASFVEAFIEQTDKIPQGDTASDYAVPVSISPAGDRVFQIGWEDNGPSGSGNYWAQRVLFLWQHPDGRFQFIGQAAEIGGGHSGGEGNGDEFEAAVRWERAGWLADVVWQPKIECTVNTETDEINSEDSAGDGLADLIDRRKFLLTPGVNGLPAAPSGEEVTRWTVAGNDQSLNDMAEAVAKRDMGAAIAERNDAWAFLDGGHPLAPEQIKRNAELRGRARAMFVRMNPGVEEDQLKAGQELRVSMESAW